MRFGVILLLTVLGVVRQAGAVTEAQRLDAITRIQQYLLSQQDPDTGSWEKRFGQGSRHYGGETALITYALLQSGMSVQEPRVRAAVDFLKSIPMNGTYAVSIRAHCWAALPDAYLGQLRADARWLLSAQSEGLFDYGKRQAGARYDHSVTQYGLLGLWEASKRGIATGPLVWKDAERHFIDTQSADGGWAYQGSGAPTASMTAAGLTALLITQELIHRHQDKPPEELASAIRRAQDWLDQYTETQGISFGRQYYYLIALERASLAGGMKLVGGRDWFDDGADLILQREHGRGQVGGDLSDTAFALLFLAHGGKPVWINKLDLPGRAWNNRPNDLNLLTRRLSDQVESDLGWQAIDARRDPSDWLNAPVAYIASDQPLWFSEQEYANLRMYLDLGGMLIATPDGDPEAFGASVRKAAEQLYPGYHFERVGADDPLLTLIDEVDLPESRRPWVLSNGVRDLIVLAPEDWGMRLQAANGETRGPVERVMTNLYAYATDRGLSRSGLDAVRVVREDRAEAGKVRAVRVLIGDGPMLEPMAWYPLADRLFNRTGYGLAVSNIRIDKLGQVRADLAHLVGVKPEALSPAQLRAVVEYLQHGGTLLVETIGGRGAFSDTLRHQLESVLGERALPIPADHPVVTGVGLPGGWDMRRVAYRRFSTLNRGQVDSPRLLSIRVNGRDAVFISDEDISMGVLGVGFWDIDGYAKDSARGLLGNLLLYVAQQRRDDAKSPK